MISIPLSILTSIVILYFMGHTLNTMTLGGMALAVGILVDDSTVTIENTHRLRSEGMNLAARLSRLRRHCRTDDGLDACDQLRVHLGGVPRRAGKIPVHPARARGGVCDVGVLCAIADVTPVIIGLLLKGEHHGGQMARATGSRVFTRLRARLRAVSPGLRARSSTMFSNGGSSFRSSPR